MAKKPDKRDDTTVSPMPAAKTMGVTPATAKAMQDAHKRMRQQLGKPA